MSTLIDEIRKASVSLPQTLSTSPFIHAIEGVQWKVGTDAFVTDIETILSDAESGKISKKKSAQAKRALRAIGQRSAPDAGWSRRIAKEMTNATD